MQVHFQDITPDNPDIMAAGQRFLQNRFQAAIQLYRYDLLDTGGKFLRQDADPRPNFQNTGIFIRIAKGSHTGAHSGIDQKILPKRPGKMKPVPGKHSTDCS